MKRYVFSVVLLLFIFVGVAVGCSAVKRSISQYQLCMSDPVCRADVESVRVQTAEQVSVAAASVPFLQQPLAIVMSNLVSGIVAFFYGAHRGKRKVGV